MAMRISYTNYASSLVAGLSSPMQPGWPITNLRSPQQPFVPAKTVNLPTGGGDTFRDFRVDFLTAAHNQLILLVNPNFSTCGMSLSNDPSFASSLYSATLTISRSRWSRRPQCAHLQPTLPPTVRYMNLRVSGPTTDGAPYYSLGGIWSGFITLLPRDIRWDEHPRIVEPHIDTPLIGGGTHRVMTGRPYVEMRARRLGTVNYATPATGDELASWLDLDDLLGDGRSCAWYFNRGNTAEGFIFRKMNESDWNVNQVVSEDELILHEVVGP